MTLQILPKESAAKADPAVKAVLEHWQNNQDALGLATAVVFYNFPLFREEEQLLVAELVLMSPQHGVVLISTDGHNNAGDSHSTAAARLEGAYSQILSRLVKYPRLRAGRGQLGFPLEALLWSEEGESYGEMVVGLPALDGRLADIRQDEPIQGEVFEELGSVDIHAEHTMAATRLMNEANRSASLS